jgi:hypothetical protein
MRTLISVITTLCLFISTGAVYGQALPADAQYNLPTNLLVNPSFEQGKKGWTNSAGTWTITKTASEINDSLSASKIALSAQSLSLSQSVTTPSGIQKQGVVGLTYKVDSAVATFQVCSLVDAAEQTCVPSANLILDGLYHSIEIPVIFGATSAGIKVKSSSSTGNVFIDAAYVKRGINTAPLPLDNVFSAKISATGVKSEENKSGWLNAGPFTPTSTSMYALTFATGTFSAPPTCTVSINNPGSNGYARMDVVATSSGVTVYTFLNNGGVASTALAFTIMCQKSGNDYLAASSSVYSQASANFGFTSYTPTLGAGFGTATNNTAFYKREGDLLIVKGFLTTGTVSAAIGSISLPSGLSLDSAKLSQNNTTSASGVIIGKWATNSAAQEGNVLSAPATDATKVYFGVGISGANSLIPTSSMSTNAITSNSMNTSYSFSVPIQGWSNAGNIVGSFAGYPVIPGYQGSVDTGIISYGATSATSCATNSANCAYLDQIGTMFNATSGVAHRGSTGLYTLNFTKTYSKVKCVSQVSDTVQGSVIVTGAILSCASCSTMDFQTGNTSALQNSLGSISCQGTY